MPTVTFTSTAGAAAGFVAKVCEPCYLQVRATAGAGAEVRDANGMLPHLQVEFMPRDTRLGDSYGQILGETTPMPVNLASLYVPRESTVSIVGGAGGVTYTVRWFKYPSAPPTIWEPEIDALIDAAVGAVAIPEWATHVRTSDAASYILTAAGIPSTIPLVAGEEWPLGFYAAFSAATIIPAAGAHHVSFIHKDAAGVLDLRSEQEERRRLVLDRAMLRGAMRPSGDWP